MPRQMLDNVTSVTDSYNEVQKGEGFAIASMVCGIIGLVICIVLAIQIVSVGDPTSYDTVITKSTQLVFDTATGKRK